MSVLLFCNNFSTTLTSSILTTDTTVTLISVAGLPTISGDQYFKMSFFDAATKLVTEIVNVMAVVGNVLTIVRAQEGTTAKDWAAGDIAAQQWTAGSAQAMEQTAQAQAQTYNYAVDTGAANAVVVALVPALTAHAAGMPIRVKIAHTNTGATTLNPGPSVVNVTAPDGSALQAGDLVNGEIATFYYNGATYQLQPVGANTARVGETRLATVGEALAGSSQTIAVTPAGLAASLATLNSVLPGSIINWPANTPPSADLECDGSSLSTSTYAALFAVVGYTFGGSGGSFSLPDLRGYFVRGWANGGSVDPSRSFGSTQPDAFASHSHTIGVHSSDASGGVAADGTGAQSATPSTNATGGSETRPVNVALMYCIKY